VAIGMPTAIRDKYNELRSQQFDLGKTVTAEQECADGKGRFAHFERGSIYWSESTGAHDSLLGALNPHARSLITQNNINTVQGATPHQITGTNGIALIGMASAL
jgi:uncharacterized protein with LGFP repeats